MRDQGRLRSEDKYRAGILTLFYFLLPDSGFLIPEDLLGHSFLEAAIYMVSITRRTRCESSFQIAHCTDVVLARTHLRSPANHVSTWRYHPTSTSKARAGRAGRTWRRFS
jgi:hypothetical protein